MKERLWNSNYIKVWSSNFLLYFSFMLLTPLFPIYLSDTFQADKQTIGLVLSGYIITALLIRPFSGYIVDSFPRKPTLVICFALVFLIFIGYPLSGSLLLFATVRTLHGAPFGAATVSNSTVAIDVLPSSRRAEGIGYYGLSNNLASAISPTIALLIYGATKSYNLLFLVAITVSALALLCTSSVRLKQREKIVRPPISLDRFLLIKGWKLGLCMACYSFSYGVLSTYIAIYGKEELGITSGTGLFFMLLSLGLMISRLAGGRALGKGKMIQNASVGILISLTGYLLFTLVRKEWSYYGAALIIGLGNGRMFPAFQTMFLNLTTNDRRGTANSTLYVSWDLGMGVGILIGGIVAEHFGYQAAFVVMSVVNALGVLFYFAYAKRHFIKWRLI